MHRALEIEQIAHAPGIEGLAGLLLAGIEGEGLVIARGGALGLQGAAGAVADGGVGGVGIRLGGGAAALALAASCWR